VLGDLLELRTGGPDLGILFIAFALAIYRDKSCNSSTCGRVHFLYRPQLTVFYICTLSNLNDIAVWVSDVAANLAVLGDRLRDKLCSTAFP